MTTRFHFATCMDHAREAVAHVTGRERADLTSDRLLQLGLTRLIEVVGEAASRVSQETQDRHADIPWRVVIGMRNRLIHGYDVVDQDVLWDTVIGDLPPLIRQLERIVPPPPAF